MLVLGSFVLPDALDEDASDDEKKHQTREDDERNGEVVGADSRHDVELGGYVEEGHAGKRSCRCRERVAYCCERYTAILMTSWIALLDAA